jgi:hypothetical protein
MAKLASQHSIPFHVCSDVDCRHAPCERVNPGRFALLRHGPELTSGVSVSCCETQDCAGAPAFIADTTKDGISLAEIMFH